MASLTGLLAGYNEQRDANTNYLRMLEAMRASRAGTDLDQQRLAQQQAQFAKEMQFREDQADEAAQAQDSQAVANMLSQTGGGLSQAMADMRQSSARAPQEMMQLAQMERQGQARNALKDLLAKGGDVSTAELGRAVLPYDTSTGINLIKAAKEEEAQKNLLARTGGTGVQPDKGYRWTKEGNLEFIPGGEKDPAVLAQLEAIKAGLKGPNKQMTAQEQKTSDAKDVLGLLDMAAPFVEKGTGGYLGAGWNMVGQAVGYGGESAQANARLKAIEGMLISKMPKMSGPQSDKDVLLYRQMAGQIGDPTVPANVKQAAMDTIRQINERAAGVEQSSPATHKSLPDPRQYSGKIARDTETGTRWMSNGRDWVRAP